jgi:hypothetical protein
LIDVEKWFVINIDIEKWVLGQLWFMIDIKKKIKKHWEFSWDSSSIYDSYVAAR